MPSRKRSPTKKNGTCKHCGHHMKGGMFEWLTNKFRIAPATNTVQNTQDTQDIPIGQQPQAAVPVTPLTNEGEGKLIEKNTGPGGRGGSESKPLFGIMGGKRKNSKKSKNSKSKKSKK